MKRSLSTVAGLALLLVLLTGCLGPKPVLQSYSALPSAPDSGKPFVVEAVIHNEGPGEGEVLVEVNLLNKQNGTTIAQDSKTVDLKKDETQRVLFEITLPPSAKNLDPQKIQVDVEAHYPIE